MSSALAVLRGRASEALHRRLNGRELPLMYPFLGLMMAGGFTTYIRGQWAANERQKQMELEMAEKRRRMGFTEPEEDPAYSGEFAFTDKPSTDSYNKKVGLASLAGAAIGVQLYRQWYVYFASVDFVLVIHSSILTFSMACLTQGPEVRGYGSHAHACTGAGNDRVGCYWLLWLSRLLAQRAEEVGTCRRMIV